MIGSVAIDPARVWLPRKLCITVSRFFPLLITVQFIKKPRERDQFPRKLRGFHTMLAPLADPPLSATQVQSVPPCPAEGRSCGVPPSRYFCTVAAGSATVRLQPTHRHQAWELRV